jgi:uncharacterized protein YuzE
MAIRRTLKATPNQLMLSAVNRVKIPNLPFRAEYDAEADTLYLRFHDDLKATRSKSDPVNGVIYDYNEKTLVGIEVLEAST